MTLPRLEIRTLRCGRGERALFHDLDVTLHAGDAARILGDNGAGKTTLLRTIAGLQPPLAGEVLWQRERRASDGEPPRLRDDLCFVAHDNALNAALTPVENLDLLMRLACRRVPASHIRAALTGLGLGRIADRACGRLSAGQKRRVSLARLWLTEAPLWLLDEPASALDVDARAALSERIDMHLASGGIAVFTTHESLSIARAAIAPIELVPC